MSHNTCEQVRIEQLYGQAIKHLTIHHDHTRETLTTDTQIFDALDDGECEGCATCTYYLDVKR